MKSVDTGVHFEEKANRLLIAFRLALAPFAAFFISAIAFACAILSIFYAFLFFLNRRRNPVAFGVPAMACFQIGNWSSFMLSLSDKWPPHSAHVHVQYSPLASRFEIFFRPIFFVMLAFNWCVFTAIAAVTLPFHALHIVLSGRRSVLAQVILLGYWRFTIETLAYIFQATDERPHLLPTEYHPSQWKKMGLN